MYTCTYNNNLVGVLKRTITKIKKKSSKQQHKIYYSSKFSEIDSKISDLNAVCIRTQNIYNRVLKQSEPKTYTIRTKWSIYFAIEMLPGLLIITFSGLTENFFFLPLSYKEQE